ncbi:MAG: ABC transporter permease [Christensenellales bacterium]|jgi:ribose/xylose/arabinose/galactoside ABC-type transport system permease subunit
MPAVFFIVAAIIAFFIMQQTRTGHYIYAVGTNHIAAEHVGISVKMSKAKALILSSLFAGIGGIILAGQLGTVTPTVGDSNLLYAIGTSMLGATFLNPGVFNIAGTVVGALLLAIISNGLTMINASFFMKDIIQGIVLLLSIGMVSVIRKKSNQSL